MASKTEYTCDVCKKPIEEGHQELFMAVIVVNSTIHENDGSAAGTTRCTDTYHVHNDFSNHCMHKIWKILTPKG